jgi:hypothetical protein
MTSYTKVNTICIKGVRESDRLLFKAEAARANKTMGDFFNVVLSAYKRSPKSGWDTLLNWKPTMTPKEADEMHSRIKKAFKTETEFR